MNELRLALIVGHSASAKGAYSDYLELYEYDYNRKVADEVLSYGMEKHISVATFLRNHGGIQGAFSDALAWRPTCIIELHFNAFNGKARGTEVLFSDNYDADGLRELALAHTLCINISEYLQLPSRGVKERASRGERGYFNLSRTTSVPSVLIEPGFGDNEQDAQALRQRDLLARAIVNSVTQWFLRVS